MRVWRCAPRVRAISPECVTPSSADGATDYLDRLEIRERERTGLDTLKVGYNAVHGYYIQISRGQSHLAPINYVRRQTLKNAERYIIPELKEYEDKVLTSKGKALALEKQLYDELFDLLLPHLADLQQSANALAELDVLVNLAERAWTLNYTCPTFTDPAQFIAAAPDVDHYRPQYGR